MMKPDPSDWPSRVTGGPFGWPPPKKSPNGVPAKGLFCWTVTFCVVEILTTAGCSFATMSAKLIGAPARGAAAEMAPGSFWATCADDGADWMAIEAAVPPINRAVVRA